MFGIINIINKTVANEAFEYMNAPTHQYDNVCCAPIVHSKDGIIHVKSTEHCAENTTYTLYFEGRIFNIPQLIQKLSLPQETAITQVLLAAYKKWKTEWVRHIEGEFVLILQDKIKNCIQILRDPLGIIPIYYATKGEKFYFSTELRRLYALDFFAQIDWIYLKTVLSHRIPQNYDRTWFEPIKRLPAGCQMTWKNNEIKVQKYYQFRANSPSNSGGFKQTLRAFQNKIETAVHRQIEDAACIDTHFSGGLDSTGIAAIAWEFAKKKQIPFQAYSCGLWTEQLDNPYEIRDDRDMQLAVAEHIGMPSPKIVGYDDKISTEELYVDKELPKYHENKTYLEESLVQIHEKKGSILLSGFGGDECITYNQYPHYLSNAFWSFRWKKLWKDSKAFGWKKTILHVLESKVFFNILLRKVFPKSRILSLKRNKKSKIHILKNRIGISLQKNKPRYELSKDIIAYLESPHISYRIEKEKEFASYYGVEMRYPYLDLELVQFFLDLPSEFKMLDGQGRKMYRKAIQKWIDYGAFVEAAKSRIATVPIQLLRQHKCIAEQLLDYEEIMRTLPTKLKPLVSDIPKPKTHSAKMDQRNYRLYLLLAEVSNFVKNYD